MGASRGEFRARRRQDWFALCYADQAVRRALEADRHVDGRAAGRFILSNARLLNVD